MNSVGETLRRARVEQGLDLPGVAARTKISARYLQAIEADDHQSLPGLFFYRSFAIQYAAALSVPIEDLEPELNRILAEEAPPPRRDNTPSVPPMAAYRSREFRSRPLLWSFIFLFFVVLSCSGFYAWWRHQR
jgi:cytoskeletal protein RodZ